MPRNTIDISAFEKWIQAVPADIDVRTWQVQGLDVWPLLKTCLVGLGILVRMGRKRAGMPMGGIGWRLGVMIDHFGLSGLRRGQGFRIPPVAPADGLEGRVLYYASGGHSRDVGPLFITPSLDVPAALLPSRRPGVFWYETLSSDHPRLARVLHGPAYGLEGLLASARGRAMRLDTGETLRRLTGFPRFCQTAAARLGFGEDFLRLWLARQVNFAIGVANTFNEIFDRHGRPDLLVLLNSCVWSTTGLVAAAKGVGVPVVEVHHGAESESAVTAPRQQPHFALFNTAPDALISWECEDRGDERVFAAGPLGLRLNEIISQSQPDRSQPYDQLRRLIRDQDEALAHRVGDCSVAAELVVSLQPGDRGDWVFDVLRELSVDVFTWIRAHAMDRDRTSLRVPEPFSRRTDYDLGTSSLLALLLNRADVHLTRFSGVTLEAAALGVPTVAADEYAANIYGRLVPPETLFVATSPRAIATQVESILETPRTNRAGQLPRLNDLAAFVNGIIRGCEASRV